MGALWESLGGLLVVSRPACFLLHLVPQCGTWCHNFYCDSGSPTRVRTNSSWWFQRQFGVSAAGICQCFWLAALSRYLREFLSLRSRLAGRRVAIACTWVKQRPCPPAAGAILALLQGSRQAPLALDFVWQLVGERVAWGACWRCRRCRLPPARRRRSDTPAKLLHVPTPRLRWGHRPP